MTLIPRTDPSSSVHPESVGQIMNFYDSLFLEEVDIVNHEEQESRESTVSVGSHEQVEEDGVNLLDELVSGGNSDSPDDETDREAVSDAMEPSISFPGDGEKLSLMEVGAIFEESANAETEILDLCGKLMSKVEWLPLSLGKLLYLVELNLSDNHIMALPSTMNGLKSLKKLDIRSNQLINLPDSFGELIGLTHLDLHSNWLKSLPSSFGNLKDLISLNLGSNQFRKLPDIIGDLISLEKLNMEVNELEELPHTIASCVSLAVLKLGFNHLGALPETLGKLQSLEILSFHYNRITTLPASMGDLSRLRELDASFNELERVPESLCSAPSLKKLNIGKNFADLKELPVSIGELEMLEELDISHNQIKVLPDSFRFLTRLRVFYADGTPLQVPPMEVAEEGAEAAVEFMAKFVAQRDVKLQKQTEKRSFFVQLFACCFGLQT